jgi:hypothetical protein
MSSLKRHFTAVIDSKENGLYISSTPSSAARKAVSKLCADNKNKKVKFSVREITQGSKKKTYGPYIGYMEKLDKPVELEGRVIKYKPVAKLDKKSSKMIGGNLSDEQNVERLSSLQSIAFTNLTGGEPRIPFVGGIIARIMNYAKEESMPIDYNNVVAFAEQYASDKSKKWTRFNQNDLIEALDYYMRFVYVEPQQTQDFRRAGPARSPDNLFSQFMRAARQEEIAPEPDIISFANWYINEKQIVTMQVAEYPSQKDIEEMLIFFKEEIMRIKPEWGLYKQLFNSTTESLSLVFVENHLKGSLKMIKAAFGGNLPTDGNHAIPNAYIFRISPTFNFDHIWEFLSNTELKGFPCFLYRYEEGFHFDKRGSSKYVSVGQVCCMFLDAVGERDSKYDPRVVRLGDFHKMNIGRNNKALESGAAITIGNQMLIRKVHSEKVPKEMVKLNPDLLARTFPGLHDFMISRGAFPLMLSIK